MQQRWPRWAGWTILVAAAGAILLLRGLLWAQAPRTPGAEEFPGFASSINDEMTPHLISGPRGEIFRLWQRIADPREGGGGVLLAAQGPQETWRNLLEIRPTERGVTARDPKLAVGPSGELAVVYRWWRQQPRAKHLRLARSDDGGKSWTQPSMFIDQSGKAFDPEVAWGKDRALVVTWADERRGNRLFDIYARRSPDGGINWDPEQHLSLSPDQAPNDLYASSRMVSDGHERFGVVWVGLRSGRSALYLSRSTDAGRTWTAPVALSGESMSVYGHSLHRAGDRLLLVWQDTRTGIDRLYAVSSADGGLTWTSPVRVDHLPAGSNAVAAFPTAVLAQDGEALVVWQDTRNGREDIYLARSEDWGRTWGMEDRRLDADEPGTAISRFPQIARGPQGQVAVAWEDDRAGYEGIYLRVWGSGRRQWGPETRVTPITPKKATRLPRILWGSNGLLHLAWEVWDHTAGPMAITKQVASQTLRPSAPE